MISTISEIENFPTKVRENFQTIQEKGRRQQHKKHIKGNDKVRGRGGEPLPDTLFSYPWDGVVWAGPGWAAKDAPGVK
jgi:hypothetical protein